MNKTEYKKRFIKYLQSHGSSEKEAKIAWLNFVNDGYGEFHIESPDDAAQGQIDAYADSILY
jgi:hypothetical protein